MADATTVNGEAHAVEREVSSQKADLRLFGTNRLLVSEDPVLIREARGRLDVYRDLARDTQVYAALERRHDVTVNAPLIVEPGLRRGSSVRKRDRMAADMVRDQLSAMGCMIEPVGMPEAAHAAFNGDFDSALYGLLDGILMGFSVAEVMWERSSGEVVASELRVRDARRFRFDAEHRLRLMRRGTSEGALWGEPLPTRKMLAWTFGSWYDPYGLGLGYRLYWPVYFKRKGITFWLRMLDKYGGPTVMGKYNSQTHKKEDQDLLLKVAASVQSDAAVIIPEQMNLELLEGIRTAAQAGYDQATRYIDSQISQAVLGVSLSNVTSIGSGTARGVFNVEQRQKGRKDSILLLGYLRCSLVRWIVEFNYDNAAIPRLRKLFPDLESLREFSQIDNSLGQVGYRRKLADVDRLYGQGQGVYEEKPSGGAVESEVVPPSDETGRDGGEQRRDDDTDSN